MKIVMYSNFINHHQLPLAEAFNSISGVEYIFVATTPFDTQRAAMGYKDENARYDFILRPYEDEKQDFLSHQLAKEADIVIVGSAPDAYMAERLNEGKVTFHTSERYFKKGMSLRTFPRYFVSTMKHIHPYQHLPLYYLCSSAYTAKDVNTFTNFKNRCFKWAYFTEVREYAVHELTKKKDFNDVPVILWAGRFLSWKHPDAAIRVAKKLKNNGYMFRMDIIGGGDLDDNLRRMVNELNLEDTVRFLGFLPPELVRSHMENADIFMFTSDFNEGWGAVLNEAMSSGCAVISSHACGAAPFLIRDGINGFMYADGNENQLFEKVADLLKRNSDIRKLGIQAYRDMKELWNPDVAAKRLMALSDAIVNGNAMLLYSEGPCSPAPILENGWYINGKNA